ncbi:hypothetical protein TRVA0_009S00210 [Trichomonascus vanleenenianus]|uniref:uncharacterized protein n=1 Tax=Trichomonascus vanleenenianus TaxID=2268995 RepID=UPI003ECB975E
MIFFLVFLLTIPLLYPLFALVAATIGLRGWAGGKVGVGEHSRIYAVGNARCQKMGCVVGAVGGEHPGRPLACRSIVFLGASPQTPVGSAARRGFQPLGLDN